MRLAPRLRALLIVVVASFIIGHRLAPRRIELLDRGRASRQLRLNVSNDAFTLINELTGRACGLAADRRVVCDDRARHWFFLERLNATHLEPIIAGVPQYALRAGPLGMYCADSRHGPSCMYHLWQVP